jgi:hypothetical protein
VIGLGIYIGLVIFAIVLLIANDVADVVAVTVSSDNDNTKSLSNGWITRYVINHAHFRVVEQTAGYVIQIAGPTGWKKVGSIYVDPQHAVEAARAAVIKLDQLKETFNKRERVIWAQRSGRREV